MDAQNHNQGHSRASKHQNRHNAPEQAELTCDPFFRIPLSCAKMLAVENLSQLETASESSRFS
jgi:hypothetical protein